MLYLIGFFLLFIIILIIITVVVFKKSKVQACDINPNPSVEKEVSLEMLVKIVKSSKSDTTELEKALSLMVEQFPFPEKEDQANKYFEFVYFFAKHEAVNAKLIVKMQKALSQKNPKYTRQIEDFQMRAVEARK